MLQFDQSPKKGDLVSNLVIEATTWYILRGRDTLNIAMDVEVPMPAMKMGM